MNVTVHAAETSVDDLVAEYLPLLLETAADITDGVVEPGDAARPDRSTGPLHRS